MYNFNTFWDARTPDVRKEFRAISSDGSESFTIYPNISFFDFVEKSYTLDDIIQKIILPNYNNMPGAKVVVKGVMPFDVKQMGKDPNYYSFEIDSVLISYTNNNNEKFYDIFHIVNMNDLSMSAFFGRSCVSTNILVNGFTKRASYSPEKAFAITSAIFNSVTYTTKWNNMVNNFIVENTNRNNAASAQQTQAFMAQQQANYDAGQQSIRSMQNSMQQSHHNAANAGSRVLEGWGNMTTQRQDVTNHYNGTESKVSNQYNNTWVGSNNNIYQTNGNENPNQNPNMNNSGTEWIKIE